MPIATLLLEPHGFRAKATENLPCAVQFGMYLGNGDVLGVATNDFFFQVALRR